MEAGGYQGSEPAWAIEGVMRLNYMKPCLKTIVTYYMNRGVCGGVCSQDHSQNLSGGCGKCAPSASAWETDEGGPGVQGQPQLWETLFQKEEKKSKGEDCALGTKGPWHPARNPSLSFLQVYLRQLQMCCIFLSTPSPPGASDTSTAARLPDLLPAQPERAAAEPGEEPTWPAGAFEATVFET